MRLPDNYIEELIKDTVGDDAVKVISYIKDKENVNDLKIAEKLKLTINQVRNIIYRLGEKNLVLSTRKKDEKTGWYLYFWTFDHLRAKNVLMEHKRAKLDELRRSLGEEKRNIFYTCEKCAVFLDTSKALETEFKCPECMSILKEEDQQKRIEGTTNSINKLTKEIEELEKVEVAAVVLKKKEKIKPEKKIKNERTGKKIGLHKKNTKKKKIFAKSRPAARASKPMRINLPAKPILEKKGILSKVRSGLLNRFRRR